jgi:hypothetical protein
MRALLQPAKDKRAVSIIVSYVLLISITIALSVLVYNWLRFYVDEDEVSECSTDVSLIIQDYFCVKNNSGGPGYLEITLKNKGLFTIDGYALRVHDDPDAEFGFYTLDESGVSIVPGNSTTATYSFSEDYGKILEEVTLAEVQPYIMDGDKVSCKSHAFQKITCEIGMQ